VPVRHLSHKLWKTKGLTRDLPESASYILQGRRNRRGKRQIEERVPRKKWDAMENEHGADTQVEVKHWRKQAE